MYSRKRLGKTLKMFFRIMRGNPSKFGLVESQIGLDSSFFTIFEKRNFLRNESRKQEHLGDT